MNGPPHDKRVASPNLTGTVLAGRYRIIRKLGAGGMGAVYLAEHTTIGKKLAVKVLSAEFTGRADLVERFLREARATSMISQENVIEISDYGDTPDGSVFFVMEHLVGEDLRDLLKRDKRVPWPRVRHFVVQICRALEAAHAAGIVHRDMKPDNCFRITRGGDPDFVKVLDFGIAKVQSIEDDGKGLTKTGMIFGTAEYMSPEQAQGNSNDLRVDVYAVGIIMYELLCGRVPFRSKNFAQTLTKHMFNAPKPPRERAPDAQIPPEAEAIVLKALQKDPALRFATMPEMIAAIEAVGTGAAAVRVVHEDIARPDTSGSMSFAGGTAPPQTQVAAEAPASLLPLWIGLGGLIVAAGLGAFVVFGGLDQDVGEDDGEAQVAVAEAAPVEVPAQASGVADVEPQATAPAEPAPEAAAPAVSKLLFDTNVPAQVLGAADRAVYGHTNDEAGVELPWSERPIALLLVADGYEELEIEVVPNHEIKRFIHELEKHSAGKRKSKPKGDGDQKQLPPQSGDSEVKNPFLNK